MYFLYPFQLKLCVANFLFLEAVDKTLNGENEFVPTKHSLFSQPSPVDVKRQGEYYLVPSDYPPQLLVLEFPQAPYPFSNFLMY